MSVVGGRLLLLAMNVWAFQFFVFVQEGDWSETTWLDVAHFLGLDGATRYLHGFENTALWVLGTPIGLELFFIGSMIIWFRWWNQARRRVA